MKKIRLKLYFWTQNVKCMISFDNTEVAFASKSNKDLSWAYWLFRIMNSNFMVQLGKVLLNVSMFLRLPVKGLIKSTIFKQFCGGEDLEECTKRINELAAYDVHTILDYSVEGKESEADFERSLKHILSTVENADEHDHIPFAVFKVTGMGKFGLLQKVNEKKALNTDEQAAYDRMVQRVDTICKRGYEAKVPILIDAEESWIQDSIDGLVEQMMERYNKTQCIVYNTLQMYRHDRLEFLKKSIEKAKQGQYLYGVKLVRGAYMEKERERAAKMGYQDPIQPDKPATDRDFDLAVAYCIDHLERVSLCCGSHNEQSSARLAELMTEKGIDKSDFRVYFAQLLGMSDHISFNLSKQGYNVAKYVPFGPVYEVLPYLIRRTEENSSISGQTSRELTLIQEEKKRRARA